MRQIILCICILGLLSACGGGGGGGSSAPAGTLTVNAGSDLAIAFDASASLAGSVSDKTAALSWSKVSGPGTVSFQDAGAASTRAAFSAAGNYTLRLSANNVSGTVSDTLDVSVAAAVGPVMTVDPATTYQTMNGWEATAFAGQDSPNFLAYKDAVYDAAVNDLGINRVRLQVRSGAENTEDFWAEHLNGTLSDSAWRSRRFSTINDNSDPNVINMAGFKWTELDEIVDRVVLPLKQRVEANGEKLWINLCYVAFTGEIGSDGTTGLQYIHDNPQEYAEFIEAIYLHLVSTYGWAPDSWEVLLEPDNVSQWNGTTIGNAIVAAANRLQKYGYTARFVAPSNTDMGTASTYYDQMLAVPGAISHVMEFSYHRYSSVSDANLQAINTRAQTAGINTAMLELIGANYNDLYKDLSIAQNSSWSQFTLAGPGTTASDDGGAYYHADVTDPANPVILIGSRTKFLRQYFKYVRRGAVRIGASASGNFAPLAFRNTDGRMVVVVKASAGGSFNLGGLAAGTYGIKYTTPAQYDVDLPDVTIINGQSLKTSIPADGVITVHAR